MNYDECYLKQNIQVEALYNNWYAWPHLISPATSAMITANLHLNILKSYVDNPELHAMAVKSPEMLGGPFVDYEGKRADEISSLIDSTETKLGHLLKFAEAVKTFDNELQATAKGFSLEPMYEKIPAPLKGYVELVYDLNHNPSLRFIEGLLYRSPYYVESAQSMSLSVINQDYRPFVLSTPRLEDKSHLHLPIRFNNPRIDQLFKMKDSPNSYAYIKDILQVADDKDELFKTFFTDEPNRKDNSKPDSGVRFRYYGHACILIETQDVSILTDPVISYDYDNGIDRYTYANLPDSIDYLIITHNHQDHVMLETLLQIRHKVKTVVVPRSNGGSLEDPSVKLMMEAIGFQNVVELDEMETMQIPGGSITGLPFFGEHSDLNIRTKLAHLVKLGNTSLMCAADSNNIEPALYDHLHKIYGDIDVLFLGMECDGAPLSWLYGPLVTAPLDRAVDQSRRLDGSNYERGAKIVDSLKCKHVYIYAMGQEPWLNYVMSKKYTEDSNPIVHSNRLITYCENRGIVAERLYGTKELYI
ncbi:MAG: MBL fold metallo-hydrolase [Gammaproteobacteria bacterium]|nr:MBL fold metallo-hydrolase [Gammaproteobacteria bacterium]